MDVTIVNSAEDYKNLRSRGGKCGGSVELSCMSRLFSNYLFRVHFEISTSNGSNDCHLLFSRNYYAEHFDVLRSNSHTFKRHCNSNFDEY